MNKENGVRIYEVESVIKYEKYIEVFRKNGQENLLGKACISVEIDARYNSNASSPSSSSRVLDNSSFSIDKDARVMACSTSFLFNLR